MKAHSHLLSTSAFAFLRSNDKETQMQRIGLIYTFSASMSTSLQTQCLSLMEMQTKMLTLMETQTKMLTLTLTVNGP